MKIAMDLDEVIADFMSALLDFYYVKKGKRHSVSEFKKYKWWPVWGMEKEESIKLVDEFHDTHKLDEIKLVDGALEVISNLMKNGNEIYIITARPSRFKKKVESWIKHHIKTNKIKVIHAGDFHKGQSATKAEICNEIGVKIILEDSGETALQCVEKGISVILFDKPWNKNYHHKRIKRVYNWGEVMEIISALS